MSRMPVILVGFDYDILDLIKASKGLNLIGYTDKKQYDVKIPYLGNDTTWQDIKLGNPLSKAVISMDDTILRKKVATIYQNENLITIISPMAYVSEDSQIDNGSLIQHGVKIMPAVEIGHNCLLNINATVHHESSIGSNSILAPGAQVLGRVRIEEQVYIGAGAIIKQNCTIGKGATIGAGAVVINDIPENSKVVGVPATRYLPT